MRPMRSTSIVWTLCALLLAGACSNDDAPAAAAAGSTSTAASAPAATQAQAALTPEELGNLGAQIRKNPADAKRLLSERGLDEQQFEQAVRKVSEDPAAAKRYAESYNKAGA
jgi:ABC-type enterochelin transport system substrate-binding protein